MTEDEAIYEAFAWVDRASLPQELARHLDPKRPVEHEVQFIASSGFSLLYLGFAGVWWLAAASFVVAMLVELGSKITTDPASPQASAPGLPTALIVLLLLGAVTALYHLTRFIARRLAVRREWREGRHRDGLLLSASGLLLSKEALALFVPKEAIQGFEKVERGRGEAPDVQIVFDTEAGLRSRLSLLHMDLEMNAFELRRRLKGWLEDAPESG